MALGVADHKVHIGDDRCKAGKALKVQVVLEILHVQIPPALQIAEGELAHNPGLGGDFLSLLAPGVVVTQGKERCAQKAQRQKDHAGGDKKLPPIEALGLFPKTLHSSAFSVISSNL